MAYRKTGLYGLLFIHHRLPLASTYYFSSTIDFLQPPPSIVHPRGPVHLASTGYYSTSPRRGPVHPPSTGLLDRGPVHPAATTYYYHGVLFIQPPPGTVDPTPTTYVSTRSTNPHVHYSSRGSRFDRLQLAAVAKESLDRVQLIVRDRSIAQVQ